MKLESLWYTSWYYYVHLDIIYKLTKKYEPPKLDKVICRHSNQYRSVVEIEDWYEKNKNLK